MTAEWRGRTDFAEYAEVAGVPTDHIMAAMVEGDRVWVMWTPDTDDLDNILVAEMVRDSQDVLVMVGEPHALPPGFQAALRASIEARLKDLGPE